MSPMARSFAEILSRSGRRNGIAVQVFLDDLEAQRDIYGTHSPVHNEIAGLPDVDLLKAGFHTFLEFQKKLTALHDIRGIHKHPYQLIAEKLILRTPQTTKGLGLGRNSAEACFQFEHCIGDQLVRDELAVVKPSRQEDFEPSK